MIEEAIQSYRAVICQCCRQPIPLPGIVLHIESTLEQNDSDFGFEKNERAFTLRCRSCEKEMSYRTTDIVDVEGMPKPRMSRAYGRKREGKLSRAANA
ncbi:MAG TPA: hypothetical protein VG322_02285 [Candidatus Acidoferrales bacterium]|jgi:hypothetical protein|nr:hypothetical protein [Candidatus Acidoferrales bacterium]